jgi:hypothetical protein
MIREGQARPTKFSIIHPTFTPATKLQYFHSLSRAKDEHAKQKDAARGHVASESFITIWLIRRYQNNAKKQSENYDEKTDPHCIIAIS